MFQFFSRVNDKVSYYIRTQKQEQETEPQNTRIEAPHYHRLQSQLSFMRNLPQKMRGYSFYMHRKICTTEIEKKKTRQSLHRMKRKVAKQQHSNDVSLQNTGTNTEKEFQKPTHSPKGDMHKSTRQAAKKRSKLVNRE